MKLNKNRDEADLFLQSEAKERRHTPGSDKKASSVRGCEVSPEIEEERIKEWVWEIFVLSTLGSITATSTSTDDSECEEERDRKIKMIKSEAKRKEAHTWLG